jgi:hypothetical protein
LSWIYEKYKILRFWKNKKERRVRLNKKERNRDGTKIGDIIRVREKDK